MHARRFSPASLLPLLLIMVFITGCAGEPSPAVGTWALSMGRMSIRLVLNADGKGVLSSPAHPGEQPVVWRDDKGTIHIQVKGSTSPTGQDITGTLSEDKNSLAITLGGVPLTLQRQQ